MLRAEPMNNWTSSIETNHSTMFMLLLELNVMSKSGYSSNYKIAQAEFL